MKLIFSILILTVSVLQSQHTFSIVAADPVTKEVGSAGATCLDNVILNGEEGALTISDIIPGIGAINTQAWWSPINMAAALERMQFGDGPAEIIEWLKLNDNPSLGGNIEDRQYGIVDIFDNTTRSAAFTGNNNFSQAGHILGDNYAIQGNILISKDVLSDMETAFLNANGTLADKLMAAMQGAKRPGADQRCLNEGVSSLSAFLRVAQPEDTDPSYGNLSLDINIGATPFGVEPIDKLQEAYDEYKSTVSSTHVQKKSEIINIYPNPSNSGIFNIELLEPMESFLIYTVSGELIISNSEYDFNNSSIDLSSLNKGMYLIKMIPKNSNNRIYKKIIIL